MGKKQLEHRDHHHLIDSLVCSPFASLLFASLLFFYRLFSSQAPPIKPSSRSSFSILPTSLSRLLSSIRKSLPNGGESSSLLLFLLSLTVTYCCPLLPTVAYCCLLLLLLLLPIVAVISLTHRNHPSLTLTVARCQQNCQGGATWTHLYSPVLSLSLALCVYMCWYTVNFI